MINALISQNTLDESLQLLTEEELKLSLENTDSFELGSFQYQTIAATAKALKIKYPNPDEILKVIIFVQDH